MKTAIIGVGRMGRRHIHVVKKLGLNLVGVVDQSRDSLAEAKKEHHLDDAQLFGEVSSLYNATKPECLIIATTADSHCRLVCEAAERGVKYILVEKPLATSLDECDQMLRICERHGARFAVNHQMRFMEQYTKPKSMLNSPEYGGMTSMTVIAGNFGMSMNGTHYVEAFRYMTGELPYEVTAWFSSDAVPNPRGPQFQDRAGSIRVTTKSGKRLYMEISSDQGHGLTVMYAARNGQILINELTGDMYSSVREEQYRELPTTRYGMPAKHIHEKIAPAEVVDCTAAVLHALIENRDSVTGEQGLLAVQTLVAAYASAEGNSRPIRIDDSSLDRSRTFPWA